MEKWPTGGKKVEQQESKKEAQLKELPGHKIISLGNTVNDVDPRVYVPNDFDQEDQMKQFEWEGKNIHGHAPEVFNKERSGYFNAFREWLIRRGDGKDVESVNRPALNERLGIPKMQEGIEGLKETKTLFLTTETHPDIPQTLLEVPAGFDAEKALQEFKAEVESKYIDKNDGYDARGLTKMERMEQFRDWLKENAVARDVVVDQFKFY